MRSDGIRGNERGEMRTMFPRRDAGITRSYGDRKGPKWSPQWPNEKALAATGPQRFQTLENTIRRAGDRTRTGDVQLGKLAFYQLNYARVLPCSAAT